MTVSSEVIPRERLSAWQRWELASLSEATHPPEASAPETVPHAADAEPAEVAAAAAAVLQAAIDDGRAKGYREGRAAAEAEALRLRSIIAALDAHLGRDEQALATEVLDLALLLARRIAAEAIAVRRELLLPIIDAALRQLPHAAQRIQIALHAEDVALVRSHLAGTAAAHYELLASPAVAPGGCIVESDACEIDGRFEARWARVVAAMGRTEEWIDAA